MAYKAEHAVDLETDMVVAARVYAANRTDHETVRESLGEARKNLALSGCGQRIEEVVADSGYHKAENLAWAQNCGLRTYIPQPRSPHDRRWRDRPAEEKEAVYANRRRTQGARGRRLRRRRGEMVERTFAHVCDSGGMRRTWLRGVVEVGKRYLVQVAARNLGVILRNLFGVGTPRRLQGACGTILASLFALIAAAATCSANLARRVISASSPLERFRCLHFSA
jgi:transposase